MRSCKFLLIWLGALLVPVLGIIGSVDGRNLRHQILTNLGRLRLCASLEYHWHFHDNPMGIHWKALSLDWAWSLAFGYWTTDFLVVQRVLSADNLRSARMAPIIGAAFKMAVPFIVDSARPARTSLYFPFIWGRNTGRRHRATQL